MYWIANLSDGQKISSKQLEKEKVNPWRRLLDYLRGNKDLDGNPKKIVKIELFVNGVTYHSPILSKNHPMGSDGHACNFWMFFKASRSLIGKERDDFIAYSYRSGDYRHFLWVSDNNAVYTQIVNVVNPENKTDEQFKNIEDEITEAYGQVYGRTSGT